MANSYDTDEQFRYPRDNLTNQYWKIAQSLPELQKRITIDKMQHCQIIYRTTLFYIILFWKMIKRDRHFIRGL